jgi:hypothetical protein
MGAGSQQGSDGEPCLSWRPPRSRAGCAAGRRAIRRSRRWPPRPCRAAPGPAPRAARAVPAAGGLRKQIRRQGQACRAAPPAPAGRHPACRSHTRRHRVWAPERSSAWLLPFNTGTSPNTVMQMLSGPCVVSPPTSSQPCASASANRPFEKAASQVSSTRGKRQGQRERQGCGAAGGQVAQVDGQRLVAQRERVHVRQRSAGPRPACRWRWPVVCRAPAAAARNRRPRPARRARRGA